MKYKLLEQFLPLLEAYENTVSSEPITVSDFAEWVIKNEKEKIFAERVKANGEEQTILSMRFADNSRLLVKMYRYAKIYGKKAIPSDSLILFDDYSYLVPLYYIGKMIKIQLIQLNIHEKSTGMEIIKRLEKTGMIDQEDNTNDKRSKYVFLTEKGRNEMDKIQANIWKLAETVNGNLTPEETLELYRLLEKLDFFHKEKLNL